MTPRRPGTTASVAPARSRSGRGGAGRGRGSALGWRSHVREDLPDHGAIVQRGDQAQPAPTIVALGAMRPNTWTLFLVGTALAVACATVLALAIPRMYPFEAAASHDS